MEIDFVVEEVQAFRREHFLHPNLFAEVCISSVILVLIYSVTRFFERINLVINRK